MTDNKPTNKFKTKWLTFITAWILVCIFWLLVLPQKTAEEIWQQNILDLEQKRAEASWMIDQLKDEYKFHESELVRIHEEADKQRELIRYYNSQIYWSPETDKVMNKICELSNESPMCWDYQMLHDLMVIAEERSIDYKLLLWIMYAESHIGANFKPYKCRVTNNRAGLKARKYNDWTVSERYDKQYQNITWIDLEWCWLYYFEDYKQFFESLANTISIWYGKCNEDVYCIMKSYVWHESGAWVRNVYLFKSL